MKRHHKLSMGQTELTLLARASVFNKLMVPKIFDVLEITVDENKISHSRIFNTDETLHTVLKRREKVMA
jgi:hypothetical protein